MTDGKDLKVVKCIVAPKAKAKRKEGPREQVDRGVVRARQHSASIQLGNPTKQPSSISPNVPNTAFSASNNTPESSRTSTDKNICFPYRRAVHKRCQFGLASHRLDRSPSLVPIESATSEFEDRNN